MPEARRGFGKVFLIWHRQSLASRFQPLTWGWQAQFLPQDMDVYLADGAGSAGSAAWVTRANRPSTGVQGKLLLLLL